MTDNNKIAVDLVGAYVSNNTVPITEFTALLKYDGKKFKSLKRHLSQLGMTPDEYRAKWNLPVDYPMVAPNYSASRSALSKAAGFGKKKIDSKVIKGRKSGAKAAVATAAE